MRALYIPADREADIECINIEDDYHTMDVVGTHHLSFLTDHRKGKGNNDDTH